jgi:hypothetical protein
MKFQIKISQFPGQLFFTERLEMSFGKRASACKPGVHFPSQIFRESDLLKDLVFRHPCMISDEDAFPKNIRNYFRLTCCDVVALWIPP